MFLNCSTLYHKLKKIVLNITFTKQTYKIIHYSRSLELRMEKENGLKRQQPDRAQVVSLDPVLNLVQSYWFSVTFWWSIQEICHDIGLVIFILYAMLSYSCVWSWKRCTSPSAFREKLTVFQKSIENRSSP